MNPDGRSLLDELQGPEGEAIALTLWEMIRGQIAPAEQLRVLAAGVPVTQDAAGFGVDVTGQANFDTLNIVSGAALAANAANPRQVDITVTGSGATGASVADPFVTIGGVLDLTNEYPLAVNSPLTLDTTGHSAVLGTTLPSTLPSEPYVVYGATALAAARQYINIAANPPGTAAPAGAFHYDTAGTDLYVNPAGTTTWRLPIRFRTYISLGEDAKTGITI